MTFNVSHFTRLHTVWLNAGNRHTGIIVSKQLKIGEVIRRLKLLALRLTMAEMVDRLEFLSDWN